MTEAGKTLVGYARRAMLELDRARAEVASAATSGVGGLVTLGLLSGIWLEGRWLGP
ncbi:MAG: hypothetical protein QM674_19930 [Burkholderiaceae bacterium]